MRCWLCVGNLAKGKMKKREKPPTFWFVQMFTSRDLFHSAMEVWEYFLFCLLFCFEIKLMSFIIVELMKSWADEDVVKMRISGNIFFFFFTEHLFGLIVHRLKKSIPLMIVVQFRIISAGSFLLFLRAKPFFFHQQNHTKKKWENEQRFRKIYKIYMSLSNQIIIFNFHSKSGLFFVFSIRKCLFFFFFSFLQHQTPKLKKIKKKK